MDFDQRQMGGGMVGVKPHHTFERPGSDIKKTGYLKKLKTNKKKFFVLRSTSSSGPARLEYHDSEKKYKAGSPPKRSIHLHACFNINRQPESRHCRNGIVLYTSEDGFVILADSPEEQEEWLNVMLEYQYEYIPHGDEHREHYEHVWSVHLQPKGLGKGCKGQYRVCLNSTSVSLVKVSNSKPQYIIQLPTIRNIAQSECSFCMEVGKYAPTGEGKFWLQADDVDTVKDMHSILHHYMNNTKDPTIKKESSFRSRSESHSSMSPNHRRPSKAEQRPASFYTSGSSTWRSSIDTTSPGSVSSALSPSDFTHGSHRPRSDTGDSRVSRGSSQHEDGLHDFFITSFNNGDTKELSVVPSDMSPPPSPKMFDEQLSAYIEMEASLHSNHSSSSISNHQGGGGGNTPVSSPSGSYIAMSPHSQPSSIKGDLSPSLPEPSIGGVGSSYMSMGQTGGSHFSHVSAPIPIHSHVSSHPTHPTPLPTVREGGSNEGYLPMDVSSSPSMSTNLRPEPVKCMLSLDNDSTVGLPPRTYSLGSKPIGKKFPGYVEMGGPRKGSLSNNDMARAISAPHIIHKGRRDRDRDLHPSDSPIPSPLSTSNRSDDSESFMEYMPMRPRTASDSFNYRPRTSSLGKLQPMCRPRSSSHGQGSRPITKLSKLAVEQSRLSQDPLHRSSRESSLHESFDSLRVSNESLRQELRHSPVVNEKGELVRASPPTTMQSSKNGKDSDSYFPMDLHKSSSPHRLRTDSSGSGYRSDHLTSSQDSEYTEMTPISARSGSNEGEAYMNMAVGGGGGRPGTNPALSTSLQNPSHLSDSAYMNMDLDGGARRSDNIRSASVENVESYVMYDPAPSGNKLRTGSVGSKDKKVSLRISSVSSKKSSLCSSQPPTVSALTRKGGSSDSIRKPTRQSSMEKYGSLGKDFRKKSGSTGSRPVSSKMNTSGATSDMYNHGGFNMVPIRKSATSVPTAPWAGPGEDPNDEYIEFSPTAYREADMGSNSSSSSTPTTAPPTSVHVQSFATVVRSGIPLQQQQLTSSTSSSSNAGGVGDDSDYTPYAPSHTSPSINLPLPSSSSSLSSSSSTPASTTGDNSDYTPYAPANQHTQQQQHTVFKSAFSHYNSEPPSHSSNKFGQPSGSKLSSAEEMSDYVGYDPSPRSTSSTSGIHSAAGVDYSWQKNLKGQQHSSLDSGSRLANTSQDSKSSGGGMMHNSTSLTFDSSHSHHQHPPSSSAFSSTSNPFHPSQITFSYAATPKKKSSAVKPPADNSDYLSYNPAVTNSMEKSKGISGGGGGGGGDDGAKMVPATSLISDNTITGKKGSLPLKVDIAILSPSSSSSPLSSTASTSNQNTNNAAPLLKQESNQPKQHPQQEKQVLQQQRQSQNIQQNEHHHPPSPLSCITSSSKHITESAQSPHSPSPSPQSSSPLPVVSENTPPWNTPSSTRQKHASGSSTSSQKSRRISGDSDNKSLRKNSKSDSNSSLSSSGSKTKRRAPSGEKSPQSGSAEKSPLSPAKSEEFFCGFPSLASGKSLEAKMVPVESKIRHSLGDMTVSTASSTVKDSQQGLSRPGSTPCIQQLDTDTATDQVSRLAGAGVIIAGGDNGQKSPLSQSQGSRSRHSLSDLGAYQHMTIGGGVVESSSNTPPSSIGGGGGGSGSGSNSGSGESCCSVQSSSNPACSPLPAPGKPLNYAELDLSSGSAEGEAGGQRVKSRNSSDADEKQPPLSYAKIDFIKSQNLNKVVSLGSGSGEANTSKS